MIRQRVPSRRAVAAIELAVVTSSILVPLLFGMWEVGRLVQVKQIVSNAAREGARLAAQGYTINSTGTPIEVYATSGAYNVKNTVYQYLISMGLKSLQPADVTVTFQFTSPTGADGETNPLGTPANPYQGIKGQPLLVSVSVPWDKVRWINAGLIRPTTVAFTVRWEMLRDEAFTVNENLPRPGVDPDNPEDW
ncbi:TadE family protein OS=Pirellula staleyi (strain ATCC 27377 / DSM 6068 / ICPB 4128) GN=Psta_2074 PE=4 SV=1: TadE [Gemmataceae bacterium]|nr:TadE family protein OS=Pirellula staleyi (strain ATCC 27377 / DSM 6068 / ICPB 4128) GN=Psta_2074 PE=4 SV=1: TadE [Gemmataceae bacterium]VTT96409.1 TadE family protein OS=Pirellula staleyi (strain ATCC 27377 / DSM 6068 / ICPB 4128) GN=Psta_2074 PE=4 SV=1: TadE [Gemmataceae bacterium]